MKNVANDTFEISITNGERIVFHSLIIYNILEKVYFFYENVEINAFDNKLVGCSLEWNNIFKN